MSRNFELLRKTYDTSGSITERPRPVPVLQPLPRGPRQDNGTDWLAAIRPLRAHWRLAAAFFALVMLAVTAVTFLMTPVYEPVAKLQIDPPGSQMFAPDRGEASNSEYLETQSNNLQTDALALMVIRDLHLDQNPEFVPSPPQGAESSADPATHAITPAEDYALGKFHDRLKVRRDTSSRIIAVSFFSKNPETAAKVTNTLVNTYIKKTYEMRRAAITESTEWLSKQLDDIREKMQASNQALADFQKKTGIVSLDENNNSYSEQMTDLSKQIIQASADRMQLEAYLRKAQEGSSDSLPQIRANPVVQALTQRLAETKAELAQTKVIYGEKHPMVAKLQQQAQELQNQIEGQKQAILSELKTSYSAAVARERLMSGTMKGTSQEMTQLAQYNTLKKEAQANTDLYNSLYAKVKEAAIAASSPSNDLNVVDEARVLSSPTRPNIPLNLGAGFMLALIGGVVVAFVYDRLDQRIHTPDEIRQFIGVSSVSVLPLTYKAGALAGMKRKLLPNSAAQNPELFMLEDSSKPQAEALRGLATSILLSGHAAKQVLLIASSFPGEGKTTIAANLAVVLSQRGPTCLVDADLRRPRIAGMFGVESMEGLHELLAREADPADGLAPLLDSAVIPVEGVPNLSILPAGKTNQSPGALVSSDRMRDIVIELRARFDYIVIDSPPILPYSDGRVLATHADGVVFVGRSGVTTHDAMGRAIELLGSVQGAPVLEVVLNGATPASGAYHYYQYRYH